MSNEWTPFPHDDEQRGSSSSAPRPREDDTQAIGVDRTAQHPAYGTAYAAPPEPAPRRSGRTLSAAA